MNIKQLNKEAFKLKINNKLDVLSLFLIFSTGKKVLIVKDVLWQPKIIHDFTIERGERKKVRIKGLVRKVYIERDLETLRVTCKIVESTEKGIKRRHLGETLHIGDEIIIEVDQRFIVNYVFQEEIKEENFLILLFDDSQAIFALIDRDVCILDSIYYGSYKFEEEYSIIRRLSSLIKKSLELRIKKGAKLIIASSSIFLRYLRKELTLKDVFFLDTDAFGDFSGLLELLRDRKFIKIANKTKIARYFKLMDSMKKKLISGEVFYGFNEVLDSLRKKRRKTVMMTSK
ncbi:hypothetical protein DRN86_02915, partial [Candidatus Geothermarchaeota archaeon]